MEYDFLVLIGRMQPFHNGHLAVIKDALTKSHNVIVILGSAHAARSVRNPFSATERKMMIVDSLDPLDRDRVHFAPVADHPYNYEKWLAEVQGAVHTVVFQKWNAGGVKIGLIGYKKDHTSSYLDMFPQWDYVETDQYLGLNATEIREQYFYGVNSSDALVPTGTMKFLNNFWATTTYPLLQKEFKHIRDYKKQWENVPYPVIFKTVDAVVICSGHILLVRRKASPGKGLMALPGGFLDHHETIKESVLRELREETRIKVPEPVLRGSITQVKTFDDPLRSSRGRTVTTAFLINLKNEDKLPEVKGGDDAAKAFWLPLHDLNRQELFEDHYDIIEYMVGL